MKGEQAGQARAAGAMQSGAKLRWQKKFGSAAKGEREGKRVKLELEGKGGRAELSCDITRRGSEAEFGPK